MNDFAEEFISYLNLIHRLSVGENAGKTQKMVQCIVNHIRYKFMRKDEIVKLGTEMLQVDNLIHIFRARFGENLAYAKTAAENLPDPYIPSNTILTLVESALVLGLIPKEGDWRLNIDLEENDRGLLIKVEDNGVSMASSRTDPTGGGQERRNEIEAVRSKWINYFSSPGSGPSGQQSGDTEPVNITCSGMNNKVVVLLPRTGF